MGGYLSVLGLVVAKDFQHQGIAGQLLNNFENIARQHVRFGVTLTCRDTLVSFMNHMDILIKDYQILIMQM